MSTRFFKIYYDQCPQNGYMGILSYKFSLKTGIAMVPFLEFANQSFSEGYDCVYINPMLVNEAIFHNPWEQGEIVGHKDISRIAEYLIKEKNYY